MLGLLAREQMATETGMVVLLLATLEATMELVMAKITTTQQERGFANDLGK
jgi:hypothetical protein